MEEKNIQRYDIFGNNVVGDQSGQYTVNNNYSQSSVQPVQNIAASVQSVQDTPTPVQPVMNQQMSMMNGMQQVQNVTQQVEPTNAMSQQNVNTVQQQTEEVNKKEVKQEKHIAKKNGYKENSSNFLIIFIFVLLGLVIIFLPQISNLIK